MTDDLKMCLLKNLSKLLQIVLWLTLLSYKINITDEVLKSRNYASNYFELFVRLQNYVTVVLLTMMSSMRRILLQI